MGWCASVYFQAFYILILLILSLVKEFSLYGISAKVLINFTVNPDVTWPTTVVARIC